MHVLLERRNFETDELEQWTASLQGAACHAWLVPEDVLPKWSQAKTFHYHDGRELLVEHPFAGVDLLTLLGALEHERCGRLGASGSYRWVAPGTPLPPNTAVSLVLEVARMLPQHPQRSRCISPIGILFDRDGRVGVVSPELAHLASALFTSNVGNPTQRLKVGLRYGSREAAAGLPTTPASDAFSLAVLLYELLTAQHPFVEASGTDFQFLEAVRNRIVPPPSTKVSGLPLALDHVLVRALGPHERRFSDPTELARALVTAIVLPWPPAREVEAFVRRLWPHVPAALQRWRSPFCLDPMVP